MNDDHHITLSEMRGTVNRAKRRATEYIRSVIHPGGARIRFNLESNGSISFFAETDGLITFREDLATIEAKIQQIFLEEMGEKP